MKALPVLIARSLDTVGLRRTAELIRALQREGTITSSGRISERGQLIRGIAYFLTDMNSTLSVLESVHNARKYKKTNNDHPFSEGEGTPQLKRVAEVIASGPLQGTPLRILDAASNHGHLVTHIKQPIERYKGIDIYPEIVETANLEAPYRFKNTGCVDYKFIEGDILFQDTYRGLEKDNNLVVCTGITGNLRPRQIVRLLNNLNEMLSDEENARMYIGFPVCKLDEMHNCKHWRIEADDGIEFIRTGSRQQFYFRSYALEHVALLIEKAGFEIDYENSDLIQYYSQEQEHKDRFFKGIHFCIKRK